MLVSDRDQLRVEFGRELGLEQGLKQGRLENARKVALKMLAANKPLSEIVEYSELSEREVLALRGGPSE
jgi:predicted transposase YdaD